MQGLELIIGRMGGFQDDAERRSAWFEHRAELLSESGPGTRPWAFWEFEAGEHPDRRTETVADALFRLRLELTPRESVQLAREWPPAQYPRLTDPLAAAAAADRRAGWHRAAGRAEMAEAWAARAEELREFVRQSSTLLEPPAYAGIERQNALTDATRKEKRK